jgi:MoaA/NifB/PqqE/SkfB family radical SAM enzyme
MPACKGLYWVIPKKLMLALYRIGSYIVYGSPAEADWIYEKVQWPGNAMAVVLNLLSWKWRIPRVPKTIALEVEPVFDCNLQCAYCPRTIFKERVQGFRPRFMSWETLRAAVDGAPDSVETIAIGGVGEPLLHPDICEIVEYVAQRGKRPILFSNCTLLQGDLLERLAKTHLYVLNVSGEPDAATCLRYRGVELATISDNIKAFRAKKRPETEVKLRITAHPGNADEIARIREAWGPIFDEIKICPVFYFEEQRPESVVCMEPWRGNINVWTNGHVTPCSIDAFEDLVIGDLAEQSLREIISGQRYRDVLARFVRGEVPLRCMMCTDERLQGLPSLLPNVPVKRHPGGTG